jgi:DNA-binding transcriptional ArsR family regulator
MTLPEPRPAADPDALGEPSAVLKALGHPARLAIAQFLLGGEASVGEIERRLGLRQPSLSQQLRALREAGVLATRREAKSVHYRLADTRATALVRQVVEIYAAAPAERALPEARPHKAAAPKPKAPCAPARPVDGGECAVFPVTRRR